MGYFSLFFVYCLILCLAGTVISQDTTFNDVHCHLEELPSSLNSASYLGVNGEFHSFGKYFEDFTLAEKIISFNLTQESAFRVYVAPHDADIDLWVYNSTSGLSAVAHSSLQVGTEEVIQAILSAGSYQFRLLYFGVWIGHYSSQECDSVTMELEIVPTSILRQRINGFQCRQGESLPLIHFGPLALGEPVQYRSEYDDAGTIMYVEHLLQHQM